MTIILMLSDASVRVEINTVFILNQAKPGPLVLERARVVYLVPLIHPLGSSIIDR